MKITTEQKQKIKEMYEQGKKQVEIAKEMGVSQATIKYWLFDDSKRHEISRMQVERFRSLPKDAKSEIYHKRLPYIKKYIMQRYHNDDIFRKKLINRCIAWQKKRKENRK